jgi:NAD(P)-dependent dehydrogenase (short-subunit alcohol dehydrogenase family)
VDANVQFMTVMATRRRSWDGVIPMKVLVTGGTSGLGLAMASALATAGATVALTGRSGRRASSVAAGLPGAVGIELDVRDESSVARAVDQAGSGLGRIDMLVNNAGIGMRTVNPRFMTHAQGFWEVPVGAFRAVIDTNLTGYFLVAREVTPRMLAAGGGRIVNISVSHSDHAPSRVRPLRAVTCRQRGAVADHGRRPAGHGRHRQPAAARGRDRHGDAALDAAPRAQGFLEPAVMGPADRLAGVRRRGRRA